MKLIRGLHNLPISAASGCVATIGNFDGVHQGHRIILEQVKSKARQLGLPAAVIIFEPQPREFFDGDQAPARILRFREKVQALCDEQIDILLCLQFNQRLRNLTAEQFIDQILVSGLRVNHLVVGDDFRFGCDRRGDFHLLQRAGDAAGFSIEHTQTIELDGGRVSSTRIRETLERGDLAQAQRLLGQPFKMTGKVIHGEKLGRQLGVPTANLSIGRRRSPLKGVFAVEAQLQNGDCLPAVANLGTRPSVNGLKTLLEVHVLDYSGDLYGQHLQVVFLEKLRDEQRFASLDALKAQIASDVAAAGRYFQQANRSTLSEH